MEVNFRAVYVVSICDHTGDVFIPYRGNNSLDAENYAACLEMAVALARAATPPHQKVQTSLVRCMWEVLETNGHTPDCE